MSQLELSQYALVLQIDAFGEWRVSGQVAPIDWENTVSEFDGDLIQKGVALSKWLMEITSKNTSDYT